MAGADKGRALAVLFEYSGLSSFVEREAVTAVVRGAIARGVRVVTVADPATEPFLRIAAAAASTAPSVEDEGEPSRPPLVLVETGLRHRESNQPTEEDRQPDPWGESWPHEEDRFPGWKASNILGSAMDEFSVKVLVRIGRGDPTPRTRDVLEAMKSEVKLYRTDPPEDSSEAVDMLRTPLNSSFHEELLDLTDELTEDKDVNQTLFSELSAATSVVLAIHSMLTRHFGRISNRSAEADEQSS